MAKIFIVLVKFYSARSWAFTLLCLSVYLKDNAFKNMRQYLFSIKQQLANALISLLEKHWCQSSCIIPIVRELKGSHLKNRSNFMFILESKISGKQYVFILKCEGSADLPRLWSQLDILLRSLVILINTNLFGYFQKVLHTSTKFFGKWVRERQEQLAFQNLISSYSLIQRMCWTFVI